MDKLRDQLIIDAGEIAKAAGDLIVKLSNNQRQISYKSTRDMVTEAGGTVSDPLGKELEYL
ncbi:MAG: hypothetical protein U9Q77_13075 [Candidatus Marinimicrobia bacterium]|nr:hypothetical protein [Candidatus Neomarinimicrobiota bacterium]